LHAPLYPTMRAELVEAPFDMLRAQ
jgi:hypothetical protein